MSKLEQQFIEDRALRNAALGVLKSDLEHAKNALSGKALASRVGSRVGDGAKDAFDIAKGHADDNRGILAALIGALLLWFTRAPLLEILGFGSASDNGSDDSETDDSETKDSSDPDRLDTAFNDPATQDPSSELVNDND
ncbi:MAG: hypothetical protein AAGL10_01865 [Pseudomonadota bacterium]